MIRLSELTFKNVLRLFELCEFNETTDIDDFAQKLSTSYQELMSILSVDSSELMCAILEMQKQIFEYCNNKLTPKVSKGGTGGSPVPSFFSNLCSVKFNSVINFNCTIFEIDNALFVDVIDNVSQFLQVRRISKESNRVQARDDDLF